ncbi:MAG: TetR/AcrR family transcriptional regulator [Desulfobacterales bacterium]|nr:TetR/AcrR family transcriptional regulator [Desulfobacterales bacterium]
MDEKNFSRKERENFRRRQEILEIALKLFSEKGFHNVTMQEIAKESEFSVGSLYNFFSNKEDLYNALIADSSSIFHSRLMNSLNIDGNELEKIESWAVEFVKLFNEHIDIVKLYLAETMGISYNVKFNLSEDIRRNYEEMINSLREVFEIGIKNKFFKNINSHLLAVGLAGLANTLLFEAIANPNKLRVSAENILEIFFDSVKF